MAIDNIKKVFTTNIRISNTGPLDERAVWPHGIDVVVTRVPIRTKDGYTRGRMEDLANRLRGSLAKNASAFLICYAPVEQRTRPYELAMIMEKAGLKLVDTIIVQRSWLPGKRNEHSLVNSYDMVFHFCNGEVWGLDRQPVKEYLSTAEDQTCCGNLWKVETGSLEDSYPPILAELLIRITDTLPAAMVFDPFMGTKSTLVSAVRLGHSFYGFEESAGKFKAYEKLLGKV